jgi:beta-lactamase regulating signal transducer with metallopeptidase domain
MLDLLLESALRSLALGVAVWLALALLRVRNPRAHMTAWTVVLVASLAMPVLMHRLTVTIPAAAPPLRVVESLSSTLSRPLSEQLEAPTLPAQDPLSLPPAAEPGAVQPPRPVTPDAADRRGPIWSGFAWRTLAAAVYLVVAGVMLLRLLTGLLLSWRMARAARPIHEGWAGGADVRVSDAVGMPVTFGSTILLPAEYVDWGEEKRQAVLSHERAHVAHGDFYVLLLASFNRAASWFNPLSWWLLRRLTELAEIISDDAALEMLDDRPSYAGFLLDLASGRQEALVAIAMARACTLGKRVERILAGTTVQARIGWRKRTLIAIALAPAAMVSAGTLVPSASKPSAESTAVTPGAPAPPDDAGEVEPHPFDRYVGYYEFALFRAVAVARAEDRLIVQETGRLKFDATAHGDSEFVSLDTNETVTFTSDAEGRTTALLLGEPGVKARRAVRIDAERAQEIDNAFARQVATAPDRFKDQLPADGSEAAVLWAIDDLQRGDPSYGHMSKHLADIARRQIAQLHAMLTALGAVESVFFRGVGPGGYDIYGAKFARGLAEFRVRLATEGNIEDIIFRPDGDSTPGGILACAQEQTLKAVRGTVPIQLVLYNESGTDIHAFGLDGDGGRSRDLMIGDDQWAPFLADVGQPWVVTDASGQCLEIIMPGQSTRFLTIPADAGEQNARPPPQRTSPMSGSEQALRRYIDALRHGEPNYEDMTPQVARYTRQEQVLNQAILARLGVLRAMLFRTVTTNGADVYFVHFANGSAEWRIRLVKQGRIGRIALGPQY